MNFHFSEHRLLARRERMSSPGEGGDDRRERRARRPREGGSLSDRREESLGRTRRTAGRRGFSEWYGATGPGGVRRRVPQRDVPTIERFMKSGAADEVIAKHRASYLPPHLRESVAGFNDVYGRDPPGVTRRFPAGMPFVPQNGSVTYRGLSAGMVENNNSLRGMPTIWRDLEVVNPSDPGTSITISSQNGSSVYYPARHLQPLWELQPTNPNLTAGISALRNAGIVLDPVSDHRTGLVRRIRVGFTRPGDYRIAGNGLPSGTSVHLNVQPEDIARAPASAPLTPPSSDRAEVVDVTPAPRRPTSSGGPLPVERGRTGPDPDVADRADTYIKAMRDALTPAGLDSYSARFADIVTAGMQAMLMRMDGTPSGSEVAKQFQEILSTLEIANMDSAETLLSLPPEYNSTGYYVRLVRHLTAEKDVLALCAGRPDLITDARRTRMTTTIPKQIAYLNDLDVYLRTSNELDIQNANNGRSGVIRNDTASFILGDPGSTPPGEGGILLKLEQLLRNHADTIPAHIRTILEGRVQSLSEMARKITVERDSPRPLPNPATGVFLALRESERGTPVLGQMEIQDQIPMGVSLYPNNHYIALPPHLLPSTARTTDASSDAMSFRWGSTTGYGFQEALAHAQAAGIQVEQRVQRDGSNRVISRSFVLKFTRPGHYVVDGRPVVVNPAETQPAINAEQSAPILRSVPIALPSTGGPMQLVAGSVNSFDVWVTSIDPTAITAGNPMILPRGICIRRDPADLTRGFIEFRQQGTYALNNQDRSGAFRTVVPPYPVADTEAVAIPPTLTRPQINEQLNATRDALLAAAYDRPDLTQAAARTGRALQRYVQSLSSANRVDAVIQGRAFLVIAGVEEQLVSARASVPEVATRLEAIRTARMLINAVPV